MIKEKIYLILVDKSEDWHRNVWTSRIHGIGPYITIDDYSFVVKSKLSAIDIFNGLSRDFESPLRVIVSEITLNNTWGCMRNELISFLNIGENKPKNNSKTYEKEKTM